MSFISAVSWKLHSLVPWLNNYDYSVSPSQYCLVGKYRYLGTVTDHLSMVRSCIVDLFILNFERLKFHTCPCFQIICYKQSPWIIGNRNFIKKTLHKVYNLWVIWVLTPVLWRAWSHTTTFPALKTRQHSKRKKSKHSDLYYQTNVFFCWTGVSHYWTQYRNSSICKWLNHDPR